MGIAYMIDLGSLGGVAGSNIFIESKTPRYPTGFGASLGFVAAGVRAAIQHPQQEEDRDECGRDLAIVCCTHTRSSGCSEIGRRFADRPPDR